MNQTNQINHMNQPLPFSGPRGRFLPFFTGPPPATTGPPPATTEQRRPPLPLATAMIYADTAGCSELIASEFSRLKSPAVVVHHPLDAIVLLQRESVTIDAAFMSLQDGNADISQFFAFLQDEHPSVRRIAFAQHESADVDSQSVRTCQHDMILWDPWDGDNFGDVLQDALNRRCTMRSTWSDMQLFASQRGTDRAAISTIVRRYGHRIRHLAADAARNTPDSDDITQEAYLEILCSLPTFDGDCSPGHWIDRVARHCIHLFMKRRSLENAFHKRVLNHDPRQPLMRTKVAPCT